MVCRGGELLRLSPLDPCHQVPRGDKTLRDQVCAAIEHFSEDKELNGGGWLLLMPWGT